MIEKNYLSAEEYYLDGFRLAALILDSGWHPDDMIALWRGGAPVGVVVHEFLYYHGLRPRHRTLKCQSYTGIETRQSEVVFENADVIFDSITPRSRVLIVDDIFDTGHTAKAVLDRLIPYDLDIRFATLYWKPAQNQTALRPDFFVSQTDRWIVFPHELDGLTPDEVKQKHPVIHALLNRKLIE